MATDEDFSMGLSEIYRRIDELSALASKNPAHIQKILPSALEELKACLGEQFLTPDTKGNCIYISPSCERIKGYSAEEFMSRKQAEEKLQESEEKYRHLVEDSLMGIGISHGNKVVFANPALLRIYGYDNLEEFLKVPLMDLVAPQSREDVIRHMRKSSEEKSIPFKLEFLALCKDGQTRVLRAYVSYIKLEGEIYAQTTFQDITEQKLAEEALHKAKDELELRVQERTSELQEANRALSESRDYLDKIINSIGDPIFVKDRQHRLVLVNNAACRLFGRSHRDLLGHTAYDLFPTTEMADVSWQMDEEVFRTGVENVNEEVNTYSSGLTRTVLVKKTPYTDDAGNQFLVGVTRDITDWKNAQEKICFQASLLDQAHNAIIATDLNGNIIYWNKFAEFLLKWTAEDVLGRNIAETVVPEGRQDVMKQVISDLITNGSCEGEYRLRRRDGSIVPTYHNFSTIKDDKGATIGFVGVATDITERKQAEEALRKSEKAMRAAKEVAEEAARAKSEFLANMSHEIRTPMNAVIGLTGLLLDMDPRPEQKECIETIRSSGDALLAVINDILDFSKIDSGKMKLEHQPFDLRSCIEESLDMMAQKAAEKGLNLRYMMDEHVPRVIIGDPARLRQILINLLSNAVKFTEHGQVEVFVTSQASLAGRHQLHFAVRDTGIGIPQDKMDRLFQSFSQVDMSTTRKYGGTGLGLAISKRLTEIMDGSIWAESDVGRGSTFHFVLPVDVSSDHLLKSEITPSQIRSSPHINMRILLAEDNTVNQKVVLKMLKNLGYRADVAADGIEALKMIELRPYDLVLMDIQMPEMDGLEATREIRKRWPNGPKIVALTAYALEGDREKCLEAGLDDYIAKPVQKRDLAAILVKYSGEIA